MTATEPSDEFEVHTIAAERLSFFADAVIAIALTLLALELPLPEGTTNAELLHSALDHRDEYIPFLISFFVIGAHWRGHHLVFRHVTASSNKLTWLSLGWLLMQVLTPFATKVLTGEGAYQSRFVFYAAVQIIAFLLFGLMIRQIRVDRLARPSAPPFTIATTQVAIMAGVFLVSIPVSFFTEYAYLCWLVLPVIVGVVLRPLRRRRG